MRKIKIDTLFKSTAPDREHLETIRNILQFSGELQYCIFWQEVYAYHTGYWYALVVPAFCWQTGMRNSFLGKVPHNSDSCSC